MLQELLQQFPRISESQMKRIFMSIKARNKKYSVIGLSRLEASKYGISERQMKSFIDYLLDYGYIKSAGKVKCKGNKFLCCVYTVSSVLSEFLEDAISIVKKVFTRVDVMQYIQSNFQCKKKYGYITFKYGGLKYKVNKKGRFKNAVYDCYNNKIVNPLNIM